MTPMRPGLVFALLAGALSGSSSDPWMEEELPPLPDRPRGDRRPGDDGEQPRLHEDEVERLRGELDALRDEFERERDVPPFTSDEDPRPSRARPEPTPLQFREIVPAIDDGQRVQHVEVKGRRKGTRRERKARTRMAKR